MYSLASKIQLSSISFDAGILALTLPIFRIMGRRGGLVVVVLPRKAGDMDSILQMNTVVKSDVDVGVVAAVLLAQS